MEVTEIKKYIGQFFQKGFSISRLTVLNQLFVMIFHHLEQADGLLLAILIGIPYPLFCFAYVDFLNLNVHKSFLYIFCMVILRFRMQTAFYLVCGFAAGLIFKY